MSYDPRNTGEENSSAGVDVASAVRPIGGLLYGVVAFVVTGAAVAGLFFQRVTTRPAAPDPPFEFRGDRIVDFLGWLVYNAHDVAIAVGGRTSFNFVTPVYVGDPQLFRLLPAAVLFVFGFVLAGRVSASLSRPEAALAGASVAVGYCLAAVAGTFVFRATIDAFAWRIPTGEALFVTAGYAVVAGGLGGLLRG